MGNRLAMQLRVLWEEIMQRFRMVEVVGDRAGSIQLCPWLCLYASASTPLVAQDVLTVL